MKKRAPNGAMAILALVNLLWAAQYPAYKIASARLSPAALNFWVLIIGILVLLPFAIRGWRSSEGQGQMRWRTVAVPFAILGTFGILPPSVMLAWGIDHSTASNAAILSLTIPVLMTLLGVIMLGERLTFLRVVSLAMALAGTLAISWSDLSHDLVRTRLLAGNAAILLAGLGSAFYNAYGKALLERFREVDVLIGSYAAAAACCLIISIIADPVPLYRVEALPASVWISILVLGAFTWGIAMVLWMWVLKRLEASQASISIYLLSVFGVALSAITLHERVGMAQIIGGLLVVFATWLTSEYEARKAATKTEALC
jgi:drug/metabolite transporter (DMT)-like permease